MLFASLLLAAFAQSAAPATSTEGAGQAPPLPTGVVARWDGGELLDAPYERFLGRSFHGKPLGREALQHILQIQLVEREAERLGLRPDPAEVERRVAEAYSQAAAAGLDLDQALAVRGLDGASFRALLADAILHEELVRRDLGLGPEQAPSVEQQQEWTSRRMAELLAAAPAAPSGYALDAPPYRVSLEELGAAIHAALPPGRQREYIEQLVLQLHLAEWARSEGVLLPDEVLQQELEWRRWRVADSPAFGGMSYEALLTSQGSSLEAVKDSEELRTAGYLRLRAERRYDDAWFAALPAADRAALEGKLGEARQVLWILLRARAEKVDALDLDFAEAALELRSYTAEIHGETDFRRLARDYSEHDASRAREGLLGWIHLYEPQVEMAVCQAAFALAPGEVSAPVQVPQGMAILLVAAVRPCPPEAEFRELVRRDKHQELREEILAEVDLQVH